MARTSRKTFLTFLPRPFLFILGCYVLGLVLFKIYRFAFFLGYHESGLGLFDLPVIQAFITGLRFDTVAILAALGPVVLLLPWLPLREKLVRWAAWGYVTLAFSLMCLALLADLRFFKYFGTHLNYQVTQYLSEGETTWRVVVTEPMFWRFVCLWGMISVLIWLVVGLMIRVTQSVPERHGWVNQSLWAFLFIVLSVVGIRGRTSISPIDWGVAYVTNNSFINQLGLNGVYTFGRAFTEEGHDPRLVYVPESRRFPFISFESAVDTVEAMLGEANEAWLEPGFSLLRRTTNTRLLSFRPNIVIVVMESWSGRNTGCLGCDLGLTPRFDSLAAHGLLFTDFYATGVRTNYGLGGILCSFPSLPGRSILTRYNAKHPFATLSEILKSQGYTNVFAYGGDLAFDNMKGFLTTKGYERFYGDRDFGLENVFAKWGIPDHVVFHKTVTLSDSLPRPFQLTLLTLSNHEPFDLPDSSVQKFSDESEESKIYNAQVYADHALGEFVDEFRTKPVFDSTIFVFVADHCKWLYKPVSPSPIQFRIPLLIYSPALLGDSGRRISTVGGQVDILPTLMGLLGGEYEHASWGRDLLQVDEADSGWTTLNVANSIALTEGQYTVVEQLGMGASLYKFTLPADSLRDVTAEQPGLYDKLRRRLHAYMQLADQMSTPLVK